MINEEAQKLINLNIVPIPLSKDGDGKGLKILDWQTTKFTAKDFNNNNNIGMNLALSAKGDADMDSKEAAYFAPKFMSPTRTLGIQSPTGSMIVDAHYIYDEVPNYIIRKFPDGKTIAELRGIGNTVVAPSVAESKLFSKQRCKRVWTNKLGFNKNPNLTKQFNKVCVASVLKTVIDSNNLDFVKLTACLKRYCVENNLMSEDELYDYVEKICRSIKNKKGEELFSWEKVVKAKVKSTLNNYDNNPESWQSGYESFADQVGLTHKYARDMFSWIGKVPKQGSEGDRKTIISFVERSMTEKQFHEKIEREYLVSPIICSKGLYIVAGKPKGGKSRILKDLAYKVQNKGLGTWLGYTVANGDVLLCALEDNEDSMNLDIKEMGYQHKIKPTTFVEQCPSLDRGLEESIKIWTEEVPNPKLVIIDTFQNVKPLGEQKTKNANAYEVDYYYLAKLHSLAKELNLCIIYVHHLNQTNAPHSWDKIMGSTGHQGCTDAMYMLERVEGSNKATFKGIGRNIAEFKIDLEWNTNLKQPFTFQFAGDTFQIATEKHKREIFMAMKQLAKDGEESVKPANVYKVLNLVSNKEKGTCNKNMMRMKSKQELLAGDKYGEYKLALPVDRYDDNGNILDIKNY